MTINCRPNNQFHLNQKELILNSSTHVTESKTRTNLQVSQLRECIYNDTKNDVQTNGGDEDEERHMVQDHRPETGE